MESKQPLQPRSYCAEAPPSAPPSPQTGPEIDPVEVEARKDAMVFALKFELRTEKEDSTREKRSSQRVIDELKRDIAEERAENAKIILALRKRVEYLEQGPLLNTLHPQCTIQPTPAPEENQETLCQK